MRAHLHSSAAAAFLALAAFALLCASCSSKPAPRAGSGAGDGEALQAESPLAAVDWADSTALWTPHVDDLGSAVDTTGGFVRNGALRVHFTLARRASEAWPFIELIFKSPTTFEGTYGVKLTYKCDQALVVKLFQSDFGPAPEGHGSYSLYQNIVPSSRDWSTIKLRFADFVLPGWADDASRQIPLDLTKSTALYFTPAIDATYGGNTLLEIRGLEFLQ